MTYALLLLANYALFVGHCALVLLSIVGWAFQRTRLWQAAAMGLTALSWFVIGPLYYGTLGLCLCTQWQNEVRHALGWEYDQNFIQTLGKHLCGAELTSAQSEMIAITVFAGVLIAMLLTWGSIGYRHWQKRRAQTVAKPATTSDTVSRQEVAEDQPVTAG